MRLLIARSEQAMRAHERVQVLVRIVSFGGVSLEALREEELVPMKMKGWKQVDRYALVGGPSWMAGIASWPAPFIGIQTRHFEPDQEEDAWRWLGEAARHT
jgi:hypothetical protein